MSHKLTPQEVIERCNKVHNNKYDYSEMNYTSRKKFMYPICPIHGKFEIIAEYHMAGTGCPKCREEKLLNYDNFMKLAREAHKDDFDDYDYSLITPENFNEVKNDLPIIHKPCGTILHQAYRNHLAGKGCKFCDFYHLSPEEIKELRNNNIEINKESINQIRIKRAIEIFGDEYDYSNTDFSNVKAKTQVFCKRCNESFETSYDNHVNKKCGCKKCFLKDKVFDTESFIKKSKEVNGDACDYSEVDYKSSWEPVTLICNKCGTHYSIIPMIHLRGVIGCPTCKENRTKPILEVIIEELLKENNIEFIPQFKDFEWLKNKNGVLSYDFYIPHLNIAIECQGKQHFGLGRYAENGEYEKILERDERKHKLSEEHNIKLLYFSNLKIKYPYKVFEDKQELLNEILNSNKTIE